MRILITTGLGKSYIGGPFQYGPKLKEEFERLGHQVKVAQYDSVESALLKIWPNAIWAETILILDTFSVGFPSVLASVIFGKKSIMRVGGDFIWSAYINRTGKSLTLPEFYKKLPRLNIKERIIFAITKWVIREADCLAFNTEWQRRIWSDFYKIPDGKTGVVRNFIPERRLGENPPAKNFLWAGRLIPEKNPEMLNKLGVEVVTGESHHKVLDKIRSSYAVTSLAFTDICPNFIIEGISYSKPFVMTKETGLKELFPRGGIFVDPNDEEDASRAFEAMQDENIYNKYVEELKSLNLSHSWAAMAEDFLKIWEKI